MTREVSSRYRRVHTIGNGKWQRLSSDKRVHAVKIYFHWGMEDFKVIGSSTRCAAAIPLGNGRWQR